MGAAIEMFSTYGIGVADYAVCQPAPYPESGQPLRRPVDEGALAERLEAEEALGRHRATLGFRPFRDGVWVLNLQMA